MMICIFLPGWVNLEHELRISHNLYYLTLTQISHLIKKMIYNTYILIAGHNWSFDKLKL